MIINTYCINVNDDGYDIIIVTIFLVAPILMTLAVLMIITII